MLVVESHGYELVQTILEEIDNDASSGGRVMSESSKPYTESWEPFRTGFTLRARQVMALACKEVDRLNHNFLGTEHLLLGIIQLGEGTAVNILRNAGIELENLRREVDQCLGPGADQKSAENVPWTPRVKMAIELAQKEAKQLNQSVVRTGHLLLGLLREGDGVAAKVLIRFGMDLEKARLVILQASERKPHESVDRWWEQWQSRYPKPESVDLSRRYDVYCIQHGQTVVYRDVLLKGVKGLFASHGADVSSLYLELEQPDGNAVFLPKHSVFKFCHPGATANGAPVP